MTRFTYNDIVRVREDGGPTLHRGRKAWVVGVFEAGGRIGSYFDQFPPGTVYSIEFEDGASTEVHEANLERSDH
jgi:hypothetical protein